MKRKNILLGMLIALAVGWLAAESAAADTEGRYEELVRRYGNRPEMAAAAAEYKVHLQAGAEKLSPVGLWKSLFLPGQTAEQGAANGLALLSLLVEDGDPAKWDTAAGFFLPSEVPKPLAAADAVYMSSLFLMKIDHEGAGPLALWLMTRFLDSSRGKHFFITTGPAEYPPLVREMTARELAPPFGVWPEGAVRGALPFGAPVRGWISYGSALTKEMVFLDGAGRPASNGRYAWDRDRGRIYAVVEDRRRIFRRY